jgi:hypothetical protein
MSDLEKLKKEDLIKVIANMHDTIQEWNNGHGLLKHDAEIIIKVGNLCTQHCIETNDWKLPII